jgi:predicted DNA-binding protein (MmcQ/YjbR family)
MDYKTVDSYLLGLPDSHLDYPFGEEVAVYSIGSGEDSKMFALIAKGKDPVQLSLKCDPQLATLLREKYDEVMPGHNLNKKFWNTLVLTGQLDWEAVEGLIRHSYNLVAGTD